MKIAYEIDPRDVTSSDLEGGFFEGWPNPPSPEAHLRILEGSYAVVIARDAATSKVVGFINAISDGVCSAYLPLLEVLPAYRGQGIGRELVRLMLERLGHLYMIDLSCDANLQTFYKGLGFVEMGAMAKRNYSRQNCSD